MFDNDCIYKVTFDLYRYFQMKGQNIYAHINLNKGERSELADLAGSIL